MKTKNDVDLAPAQAAGAGRPTGFTLVELLVVIAIIALLMSLLFPMLGAAQNKMLTLKCADQQRKDVNALILYAVDYDGFLVPVGHKNNWKGIKGVEWWFFPRWLGSYLDLANTNMYRFVTCPALKSVTVESAGIGYNHMQMGRWLGGNDAEKDASEQARMSDAVKPAATVAFADSAWVSNPSETDPEKWKFPATWGDHLFRTPDNPEYDTSPQRAVNRHGNVLAAGFLDGHSDVLSVKQLGFQYDTVGHALAMWDMPINWKTR